MKPEPMTAIELTRIYSHDYGDSSEDFPIARAIIAARDAQWEAMLAAPHEAKTEAEKTAYASGWFKALESVREKT